YADKHTQKNLLIMTFLIFLSTLLIVIAEPTAPDAGRSMVPEVGRVSDDENSHLKTGESDHPAFDGEHLYTDDSVPLTFTTVARHLDVPWEITWGPDNWIWFTEQSGSVSKVNP